MLKVLTAEEMRTVDRLTTERYGIPSILLMENAAHAVARVITEKLGGSVRDRRILIVCGKGNNGGDGAALARILWNQGASCFVQLVGSVDETRDDAKVNFVSVLAVSGSQETNGPDDNCLLMEEISEERRDSFFYDWRNQNMCVLVDALFGTGLTRPLDGSLAKIAKAIERARKRRTFEKIFAVDLPSGIDADCGSIGASAAADVTVTFTAPKPAHVLAGAPDLNGELVIADIGSPPHLIEDQPSQLFLAELGDASRWLKASAFSSDSYKNKRGHALLVAGSSEYSGAAVMCGNSAMRSGVGLVTLCVPESCKVEISSRIMPEVIVRSINENADGKMDENAFDDNREMIEKADAILVGCGLSATDKGVESLVREIVQKRTTPVVVDASALSFLSPPDGSLADAGHQTVGETGSKVQPLILTPHEGEFMRLLGIEDKDVLKDRVTAVRDYAISHNVILVLKGERVLIGAPDGRVIVNPTGNSGLGKAGNGDTLAGIVVGFVAQAAKMDIDILETVVAAVYIAGMAGDLAAAKYGKRVMTASDVRECLSEVFESLTRGSDLNLHAET